MPLRYKSFRAGIHNLHDAARDYKDETLTKGRIFIAVVNSKTLTMQIGLNSCGWCGLEGCWTQLSRPFANITMQRWYT